ncbi:hypothetical protein HaLaN_17727, partial [Haematococcus lacustris]
MARHPGRCWYVWASIPHHTLRLHALSSMPGQPVTLGSEPQSHSHTGYRAGRQAVLQGRLQPALWHATKATSRLSGRAWSGSSAMPITTLRGC